MRPCQARAIKLPIMIEKTQPDAASLLVCLAGCHQQAKQPGRHDRCSGQLTARTGVAAVVPAVFAGQTSPHCAQLHQQEPEAGQQAESRSHASLSSRRAILLQHWHDPTRCTSTHQPCSPMYHKKNDMRSFFASNSPVICSSCKSRKISECWGF